MIYFTVFLTTLVAAFGNMSRAFPARKGFVFAGSFLFFIVAFRYASVDYFSYLKIYHGVTDLSKFSFFIYSLNESTPVESGFAALIILEKILFGHFFVFIFIFSFISLLIKFLAFDKLSPYLFLSLLLYLSDEYFWKDLGQMRNGMASGVLLWAFYHAYFKRFFVFLALCLIAMLFHSAAFVALPFYFVRWFKSRFLLIFFLSLSVICVFLFGGFGFLIPEVASHLGFEQNSRIIKYASSQYASGIQPFGGTFSLQLLNCIILIVFYKRLIAKWPLNDLMIPVYVYSSCLFFVFLDYGIIAGRIREMLSIPIACVVIPTLVLLFRGYSKFLPCCAIISYCSIWFYMMLRDRAPYQSILQFLF